MTDDGKRSCQDRMEPSGSFEGVLVTDDSKCSCQNRMEPFDYFKVFS